MDRSERKAAVSAYKERKPVAGVYAIRCAATDGQWVGAAPDFPRSGPAARSRSGKASRRTARFSPPGTFTGPKVSPSRSSKRSSRELTYGRERALKERIAHWREALGAAAI